MTFQNDETGQGGFEEHAGKWLAQTRFPSITSKTLQVILGYKWATQRLVDWCVVATVDFIVSRCFQYNLCMCVFLNHLKRY